MLGPGCLGSPHDIVRPNPSVLVVDLEVHTRRVVEDEVDIEAQQVGHAEVDGPLDGRLLGFQEVHRPVQVLQRERLSADDAHLLNEPLAEAVELGGRGAGAVRYHREQRTLNWEVEAASSDNLLDDLGDPEPCPQRLERVDIPVGPGVDHLPVWVLGHDLLGRGTAQDAPGESAQALGDLRVFGTTAAVEDAGLGAALVRVPDALGKLQVGDHRAVGTLLAGLTPIHVREDTGISLSMSIII